MTASRGTGVSEECLEQWTDRRIDINHAVTSSWLISGCYDCRSMGSMIDFFETSRTRFYFTFVVSYVIHEKPWPILCHEISNKIWALANSLLVYKSCQPHIIRALVFIKSFLSLQSDCFWDYQ